MSAAEVLFKTDGYKLGHIHMYPPKTEFVLSNFTPRASRLEGVDKVVFFGLQHWLAETLGQEWGEFFAGDIDEIAAEYDDFLLNYLGPNNIGSQQWRDLHALGYLPLEFRALPEGTSVPLRVPMFTVENTHPDFYWLVNYLETSMSNALWMPCTSATIAKRMRTMLNAKAVRTGVDIDAVAFGGHDFSMRGMSGIDACETSGAAHLVSFTGSDSLPAIRFVKKWYPTDSFIGGGVPATEHAVMCAGGKESEMETFRRLLKDNPTGIISVVSDTWDLWKVLTVYLPALKDEIMAREGTLVIRPDSGDPANILCGDSAAEAGSPASKGVVRLLEEAFGTTTNEAGFKTLDSHVGAIYGDSINFDRADDITDRLIEMGFVSTQVVLGMGSYGYQMNTRDTFGFAIKATNVVIDDVETPIFKDPITDDGTKKSLKGRIAVFENSSGELAVADNQAPGSAMLDNSLLKPVWRNGEFIKEYTFDEVRATALGS
jgi:nicotinamide phosphoribosyltransferase